MTAPTESTSAALRRVEAERDEALAKRDQAVENGDWWLGECRKAQADGDRIAMRLLDTSTELRKTQQDFAASQADLSRMERERDQAFVELDEMRDARNAARSALKVVGEQRDLARAELASARAELAQLRARVGGDTDV